jgi:hypothetical protein
LIIGDGFRNIIVPHRGNDTVYGRGNEPDWLWYNESSYPVKAYLNESSVRIPVYNELVLNF